MSNTYGGQTAKIVDGDIKQVEIRPSIPSLLWHRVVGANESVVTQLPNEVRNAKNLSFAVTPLDFSGVDNFVNASLFVNTAGRGRSAVSTSMQGFYSTPLSHQIQYNAGSNVLSVRPATGNVSAVEYAAQVSASRENIIVYQADGSTTAIPYQQFVSMTILQLFSAGIQPFSVNSYLVAVWAILVLADVQLATIVSDAISRRFNSIWVNGSYNFSNPPDMVERFALVDFYRLERSGNRDLVVYRRLYMHVNSNVVSVSMLYNDHRNQGSASRNKWSTFNGIYSTWFDAATGPRGGGVDDFDRYLRSSNIGFPDLLANNMNLPPNFSGSSKHFIDRMNWYWRPATVRESLGTSINILKQVSSAPSDRIRINQINNLARSVVCVFGEAKKSSLPVADFGFSNADGTINQQYKNFFLLEQNKVTINSVPNVVFNHGHPANGGVRRMFRTRVNGSHVTSSKIGVHVVPLQSQISRNRGVLCMVHAETNTGWNFAGFKSQGNVFTHAVFFTEGDSANKTIMFSVIGEVPTFGGEYKTMAVRRYSPRYLEKNVPGADSYGRVSGGNARWVSGSAQSATVCFVPASPSYGAVVRNASREIVFNSTAFEVSSLEYASMSSVSFNVLSGNNSGKSTPVHTLLNRPRNLNTPWGTNSLCVLAGTFNVNDLCFNDVSWNKTQKGAWYDLSESSYFRYIQYKMMVSPMCYFSGTSLVNATLTMVPIWDWYILEGSRSVRSTMLGGSIGFLAAGAAAFFGFYSVAVSLVIAQNQINNLPQANFNFSTMGTFLYFGGKGHFLTGHVPKLVQ